MARTKSCARARPPTTCPKASGESQKGGVKLPITKKRKTAKRKSKEELPERHCINPITKKTLVKEGYRCPNGYKKYDPEAPIRKCYSKIDGALKVHRGVRCPPNHTKNKPAKKSYSSSEEEVIVPETDSETSDVERSSFSAKKKKRTRKRR